MRRDDIIARLKQVEPVLRAKGVGALYVFGSAARDEARAGSDLDVFIDPQSDEQSGFSNIWMPTKPSAEQLARA
jgi:predicted nucleotidyltransferase